MNHKTPEDITFQVTVGQLTISSPLPQEDDFRVTIGVGDVYKITCSGDVSPDGLMVTWNHPFLFSAPPSMAVEISVCCLPEELSIEWGRQLLGDWVTTDVASLLESENTWQCNISWQPTICSTLFVSCKPGDTLVIPDGHEADCLLGLMIDNKKLYSFGTQIQNLDCILTNIQVDLARLDLCPLAHEHHIKVLNDLAISFGLCYDHLGDILDLHRAIELLQAMLNLCPLGHPSHTQALGGLVIMVKKMYYVQRNAEDLHWLIGLEKRWLELCPPGHSEHGRALGVYASSLWDCYYVQKNMIDLDQAIKMGEKALELCPEGNIDHNSFLCNLALLLNAHYRDQGNLTDLSRAIELQEKHLELCPLGHYDHGTALQNLAISLRDQFDETGHQADLIRAIKLFKEALDTYSTDQGSFASCISQLTETIFCLKSSQKNHPSDQPLSSLEDAFETFQLLKECGPAVSLNLLEALQEWVKNAEEHNHSSTLEAYQTLLSTLDHFTSFNSSLDFRHQAMQASVDDAANNAFSCAIRRGDLQLAVELLEQGRGILWNQLARCDISIATLESFGDQGRELGREFTRLSAGLRKHAEGSGDGMEPYWQVREGWQSVVNKIRGLDGFSRFLLPPHFEDLQQAAEHGPVIIVNASKYTCDALIVLRACAPVHVALPCSLADVDQLCSQMSELTRDPHAYGDQRESYVKQTLRDLWSSVVEPIALILQNDIELPPGSRVWWCPASIFTLLPLHAAGPHRKGQTNFFDIYVSSYAPSLSALLRAQERIRSQRLACDASGSSANPISFAAVGQGRPSADAQLSELPEVAHEIHKIHSETGMPPDVAFETVTGTAATVQGVVQAFRDHCWVHVACHGAQHAEKPFDSWFAMGDGKLTLMRIIQERYTNSEFAFLSACHTAVGDASTPDEVLHLAAGMQFAGFNGVIGTLWRVDDAVAHQIVTRFYKEMFKQPVIGFEHAAAALNTAVVETASEVSLEKRVVFVHIGI